MTLSRNNAVGVLLELLFTVRHDPVNVCGLVLKIKPIPPQGKDKQGFAQQPTIRALRFAPSVQSFASYVTDRCGLEDNIPLNTTPFQRAISCRDCWDP
jgi:hypothetical protein